MSTLDGAAARPLLYGRRRGRALRPGQQRLLDTLLPRLAFALPEQGMLDPRALFSESAGGIWLEVGFGGGEHLFAQAEAHPAIGFIGAEVFENGIAKLLAAIEQRRLGNIRLFVDDARLLLARLPPRSLGRAFILFPDPWPKERHWKRRFVAPATLDELARTLIDGSELRLASDDRGYARAMLQHATAHRDFRWLAECAADWRTRPADWPPTRYEQKALAAGRAPLYLRFARRARDASL